MVYVFCYSPLLSAICDWFWMFQDFITTKSNIMSEIRKKNISTLFLTSFCRVNELDAVLSFQCVVFSILMSFYLSYVSCFPSWFRDIYSFFFSRPFVLVEINKRFFQVVRIFIWDKNSIFMLPSFIEQRKSYIYKIFIYRISKVKRLSLGQRLAIYADPWKNENRKSSSVMPSELI